MEGSFFWLAPEQQKRRPAHSVFVGDFGNGHFLAAAGQLFVNIRNQIQMITISDIIDIANIAYIAYRMCCWCGTAGRSVAKAIVLLLAALSCQSFRLNVVNFILSKTWTGCWPWCVFQPRSAVFSSRGAAAVGGHV
jgi:hypothetical protein